MSNGQPCYYESYITTIFSHHGYMDVFEYVVKRRINYLMENMQSYINAIVVSLQSTRRQPWALRMQTPGRPAASILTLFVSLTSLLRPKIYCSFISDKYLTHHQSPWLKFINKFAYVLKNETLTTEKIIHTIHYTGWL